MLIDNLSEKLKAFSVSSRNEYFSAAFSRSLGLISANDFELLKNATIAIPGMGGVGGAHLIAHVRAGIGKFKLADFDSFDVVNINRQYGATIPALGHKKLETMAENALNINPYLELEKYPKGVTEGNVDAFLEGVDVVIDGLDFFVFEIRRTLFKRALEKGIPVITAGPMGFSTSLLIFSPEGMGFDEYFDIREDDSEMDRLLKFAMGLAPSGIHISYIDRKFVDLTTGRGPSLASACQLCAGAAVTESMRIILGRGKVKAAPYYSQFDPYKRKYIKGRLIMGNRNPIQRAKLWLVRNFLVDRNKVIGPELPDSPDKNNFAEVQDYIIKAGIQAPSGDNCQPWIFGKGESSISLDLDREVDNSFFNLKQSASAISCGAAVENMILAAQANGYDTEVDCQLKEENGLSVLLGLEKNEKAHEHFLYDSIWRRNTNRKLYSRTPVEAGLWESAREAVCEQPGVNLEWISSKDELKRFAKPVFLADKIRAEHKNLHEFLYKKIRFSRTEAAKTRDGLPLDNLEAGLMGDYALKATKKWAVTNALNHIGFSSVVAQRAAQGILRSGGIGLLSVDSYDLESLFRAGRALERAWLIFTHFGIEFQPVSAPALFRMRVLWESPAGFKEVHQRVLEKIWPMIDGCFPGFSTKKPVMFFRVGFAKTIRYGTYRRPLPYFLK